MKREEDVNYLVYDSLLWNDLLLIVTTYMAFGTIDHSLSGKEGGVCKGEGRALGITNYSKGVFYKLFKSMNVLDGDFHKDCIECESSNRCIDSDSKEISEKLIPKGVYHNKDKYTSQALKSSIDKQKSHSN